MRLKFEATTCVKRAGRKRGAYPRVDKYDLLPKDELEKDNFPPSVSPVLEN